ncbi:hypothetical protein [Endozoicomonas numazuensis]|uniref:Uncharacterized protein n=1 Tax=Endozoicomonas numazuensis TaxID=1137799 RepID=A0A081NDF2_9GAMM|nr:hypothetical protein [Endozoicomonas numazuensis]KEQ16475.1 hypothetical protein GZ78_21705 [Endozoicomonas numazuensis]
MDGFDAGAKGKPLLPVGDTEANRASKKDEESSQACKPKIPKAPETTEESTPREKAVDERSINELPEVLTNIEWFEFSAEANPKELSLLRTKHYCAMQELEATAAAIDVMGQQEKKGGQKKKAHRKEMLQRMDLPKGFRAKRCKILFDFGHNLTQLGQLEEAQTVLYQALKDVDASPQMAADIAYSLFMNYSLAGDCCNALTQLQLSIRHGNNHALWEIALIRLGLVKEYQAFSDPEKALSALDDLALHIRELKEAKSPEAFLYADTADTGSMVEGIWEAFRPVLEKARNRGDMEKQLLKILRVEKSDQTERDLQELLELFRDLSLSIHSQEIRPLVNFYSHFGRPAVERLWKFWTEKDEMIELVESDTETSKLSQLKHLLSSEFSQEELRILIPLGSGESLVEVLDTFINQNIYDFRELLKVAILAQDSITEPAPHLELDLKKLTHQAHNDPESDHRLSAMSVSASPVLWARDCLRIMKEMDFGFDLTAAFVRAECLRRQNPALGLYLMGLCHLHPANGSFAKALPLIDEAALVHDNPVAMVWMGDAVCMRGSSTEPSKAHFQKALKYYLRAGRFGSAAGYIRAADLLLSKVVNDTSLYDYCSQYFEKALELAKDQGEFEEARYCRAMAELCRETYLLEEQKKPKKTDTGGSTGKGNGSPDEKDSEVTLQEEGLKSHSREEEISQTPEPKVETAVASKERKPAKKPLVAKEFWKQLNVIDGLISEEQYTEAMGALKSLQKKKLTPLHSSYLLQKKA